MQFSMRFALFRYVKMPEYDSCKEDNVTANTLSDVKTPCPVESKYD